MQRRKCKGLIRRIFGIFMALLILLSGGGWDRIISNAIDSSNFKVDSVTIYKIYNRNRNLETRRVLIIGSNIEDAEVGIIAVGTGYQPLTNRTTNSSGILQFDLTDDQVGNSIMIEGYEIHLDEANMPTLSGVTRQIERDTAAPDGEITFQGSNLDQINNGVTAKYEPLDGGLNDFTGTTTDGSKYSMTNLTGALGLQNIIFEKTQTETVDFPNHAGTNVTVTITYNYQEQFRLVESINNLNDLKMFPNRGEVGEKVYFTGQNLDEYDVFFLTDINGTDPYTNENKGKNKTFLPDSGATAGEDVLTVEVPNINVGEYYVVLTNAVAEDKDPMNEVNQVYVVKVDNSNPNSDDDKFYVIDGSSKANIISIQPNSGPDSGQEVTISGEFLGTLNIPEFTPDDPDDEPDVEDPSSDADQEELIVNYLGGTYNNFDVTKVTRTINITIGDKVKFATDSDASGNSYYECSFTKDLDTIRVITPQINDAEDDPIKDVVAEIETIFEIDEDGDGTADSTIVIKERAELEDGYTYIPSKVTPTITEVIPEKIQVENNGTNNKYKLVDDILIGIYGENFAVHKYDDGSGNEKVMYPQIEIGGIVLNKSFSDEDDYDPDVDIRIYNDNGEELDGTEENEVGTKILITIPETTTIDTIGKTFVKITNPVRNSVNMGLSYQLNNAVEFVTPSANKIPVINNVVPNVVTVDGGEEVEITGSNFQDGVKVFIDGEEVEGINRSQDGKSIIFTSPEGREGETQLLVMNEEGGMDTFPFTYVKTYTNPQITDFSPKKGNTGTLVVVTGDNFLLPDPTADEDSILKLIGTRILLEGEDISTYNLDPSTKEIILQDYTAAGDAKKILRVASGELELQDYYHSIVLYDEENDNFYTIEVDVKGNQYITNGVDEEYELSVDGSNMEAEKVGGGIFTLSVKTDATGDYIELDGAETKKLRIKTPFKVDDNVITGDNVKVVDKNTIYFTVPILPADGYYDLTVVNPDTKKDTKKDEEGFYYYKQPQSKPEIEEIKPDHGSTEGGYAIVISGSKFEDNGSSKTSVIINGVKVDEEDVEVNADGTEIKVVVPAYNGDLSEDSDTDRITVPVVVVNPDGGSYSKEDGFTYVIPSSNPEITRMFPESGSAAGGEIVEIWGADFRFFEPYNDENRNQEWDFDDLNGNGQLDPEEPHEYFVDINGDGAWTEFTSNDDGVYEPDNTDDSLILPKIYFGDEQAEIAEFSKGYLKVILPPGKAGTVDVYIVNNDSGISNTVEFTYESSNPVIDTVIPDEGKKQGKDEVEINGENFQKSNISVYQYVYQDDSTEYVTSNSLETVLVNFGRITNTDIERDEENSGLINSSRATVNLDGNLSVEYDATNDENHKLKLTIEEDDVSYQRAITGYDDSEVYIDVRILEDDEGNSYDGYELIHVWVEDRRLFVERGYSPEVEYVSSQQLIVSTPSYYTIGTVPLFVINPDGGEAEAEFTYKNPDSSPKITNITKEGRDPVEKDGALVLEVTYKGGNTVSIHGNDFREGAIIRISDLLTIEEEDIIYQLPNKLTFTMPAVPEDAIGKLYRAVVINKDGGVAASDAANPPIYIQFIKGETLPEIGSVTPDKGPSTGGTEVTIKGDDFRDIMNGNEISVYFGSTKVPDEDVEVVNYQTIVVYTPAHEPGEVEVKVENPDGELSAPVGTFTYISVPKIISVVDTENENRIYTVSVEGGEKIRIKGSGFDSGARVIFNPVLTKVEDEESAEGELVYIGEEIYVLEEGVEASDVEYEDTETLDVTTPQGQIGDLTIIVINPDGGGSDIYKGLEYGLPDISAPSNVVATLMYDKYIRVEWKDTEKAFDYEVFVIIDDGGAEYIGSTDSTFIIFEDLEERTDYRFLVKSVGEYGESSEYGKSNTVTTGRDVDEIEDEDGEIAEDTKIEQIGDRVEITVGTSDYDDNDIELDITKTEYAGVKEITISMPAEVISSYDARDIKIIGGEFRLKFNPKIFYNTAIRENRSNENVGVRFKISFGSEALEEANKKLSEGYLSKVFVLEGKLFDGEKYSGLEYLKAGFEILLDFDLQKANIRRYKRIEMCRYDEYEGSWVSIAARDHDYTSNIRTISDRLGKYSIIGKRQSQ